MVGRENRVHSTDISPSGYFVCRCSVSHWEIGGTMSPEVCKGTIVVHALFSGLFQYESADLIIVAV